MTYNNPKTELKNILKRLNIPNRANIRQAVRNIEKLNQDEEFEERELQELIDYLNELENLVLKIEQQERRLT